jgi:ABC-type Zn uptake system ZnuABC Zn-binding protein ZnuA
MNSFIKSMSVLLVFLLGVQEASAKLRVVTTTTDLAELVRQVGGEHVQVESICKANQDPHYLQARPSLMVKMRHADLVVAVGLELEAGWLPLLIRGSRNPKIRPGGDGYMELGSLVNPIDIPTSVDASHGHVHAHGNPHFWLDPVRYEGLIVDITRRLMDLDRAHGPQYKANAHAFTERLMAKIIEWRKKLEPYKGTLVLSYHDTFNYFLDRFGLVSAGTLENKPGIPPTPRHLSRVIQRVKRAGVPVLFHERFHDQKPSAFVASRSGATLLVMPTAVGAIPEATDYISFIDSIVDRFITAMESRNE